MKTARMFGLVLYLAAYASTPQVVQAAWEGPPSPIPVSQIPTLGQVIARAGDQMAHSGGHMARTGGRVIYAGGQVIHAGGQVIHAGGQLASAVAQKASQMYRDAKDTVHGYTHYAKTAVLDQYDRAKQGFDSYKNQLLEKWKEVAEGTEKSYKNLKSYLSYDVDGIREGEGYHFYLRRQVEQYLRAFGQKFPDGHFVRRYTTLENTENFSNSVKNLLIGYGLMKHVVQILAWLMVTWSAVPMDTDDKTTIQNPISHYFNNISKAIIWSGLRYVLTYTMENVWKSMSPKEWGRIPAMVKEFRRSLPVDLQDPPFNSILYNPLVRSQTFANFFQSRANEIRNNALSLESMERIKGFSEAIRSMHNLAHSVESDVQALATRILRDLGLDKDDQEVGYIHNEIKDYLYEIYALYSFIHMVSHYRDLILEQVPSLGNVQQAAGERQNAVGLGSQFLSGLKKTFSWAFSKVYLVGPQAMSLGVAFQAYRMKNEKYANALKIYNRFIGFCNYPNKNVWGQDFSKEYVIERNKNVFGKGDADQPARFFEIMDVFYREFVKNVEGEGLLPADDEKSQKNKWRNDFADSFLTPSNLISFKDESEIFMPDLDKTAQYMKIKDKNKKNIYDNVRRRRARIHVMFNAMDAFYKAQYVKDVMNQWLWALKTNDESMDVQDPAGPSQNNPAHPAGEEEKKDDAQDNLFQSFLGEDNVHSGMSNSLGQGGGGRLAHQGQTSKEEKGRGGNKDLLFLDIQEEDVKAPVQVDDVSMMSKSALQEDKVAEGGQNKDVGSETVRAALQRGIQQHEPLDTPSSDSQDDPGESKKEK